jgi:hypothetical protein
MNPERETETMWGPDHRQLTYQEHKLAQIGVVKPELFSLVESGYATGSDLFNTINWT